MENARKVYTSRSIISLEDLLKSVSEEGWNLIIDYIERVSDVRYKEVTEGIDFSLSEYANRMKKKDPLLDLPVTGREAIKGLIIDAINESRVLPTKTVVRHQRYIADSTSNQEEEKNNRRAVRKRQNVLSPYQRAAIHILQQHVDPKTVFFFNNIKYSVIRVDSDLKQILRDTFGWESIWVPLKDFLRAVDHDFPEILHVIPGKHSGDKFYLADIIIEKDGSVEYRKRK